ncbi:ester cyclase [Paludisphaera sp.]|uniref:ester cyclase n=1 Tax=Paludisphaera sp. TaxID=2017432 RepID=UPI00301C7485
MSEQNRRTSRRWFEEVWNGRDASGALSMCKADAVGHSEGGDIHGLDEFMDFRARFLGAFPDLTFEVESVAADGDDAVVRWVARGTHTGDALGIPACRKTAQFRGTTWHHYEDGVIAEVWDSWNLDGLMKHLTEDSVEAQAESESRPAAPPALPGIAARPGLADRISEIREEVFGEHGGPELARRLGIPGRTLYDYETGATVPAEILLKLADLTGVELRWLMTGEGPRYQKGREPKPKA